MGFNPFTDLKFFLGYCDLAWHAFSLRQGPLFGQTLLQREFR
jgi:hypothetical protein